MIEFRKRSLASYDITGFRLIKAGVTLLSEIIANNGFNNCFDEKSLALNNDRTITKHSYSFIERNKK